MFFQSTIQIWDEISPIILHNLCTLQFHPHPILVAIPNRKKTNVFSIRIVLWKFLARGGKSRNNLFSVPCFFVPVIFLAKYPKNIGKDDIFADEPEAEQDQLVSVTWARDRIGKSSVAVMRFRQGNNVPLQNDLHGSPLILMRMNCSPTAASSHTLYCAEDTPNDDSFPHNEALYPEMGKIIINFRMSEKRILQARVCTTDKTPQEPTEANEAGGQESPANPGPLSPEFDQFLWFWSISSFLLWFVQNDRLATWEFEGLLCPLWMMARLQSSLV